VGFLSDIGLGFLDGGSSGSSVSSSIEIKGLDNMKTTLAGGLNNTENINLAGGTPIELKLGETIDLKPVSIELKPVTLNENIDLKPVTLNENIDLKPVTLNENIDLKPVAVDTCQTFKLAPLPETQVCQPYHHHVGYTMYGVEYMGVTFHGESKQRIESPRHPQVVERIRHNPERRRHAPDEIAGGRGIRVRVVDPDE
jgi:hypothetical protein